MAGEPVRGAMVFECFVPGIAQILANAGCQFAMFDMEHAGLGYETLKMLAAACNGIGIAPMARVPRGEYHFLARALDVGAQGVMVPMVESAAEARAIAEATRYPPAGRRGAAFGFAHDGYQGGDVHAKMQALDARNLVIAQIETERGLDEVEAIAAVPGIDVLWVGHFDLTNFLGIPAQFDHPRFEEALRRVVSAARANGKGAGLMASDDAWTKRALTSGFNVIAAGPDQAITAAGYRAVLAAMPAAGG
jgi:2-dehydro-3-deoxyglucarate aldolase/4-hydroxy-2-oxoheptanedioate aldolase